MGRLINDSEKKLLRFKHKYSYYLVPASNMLTCASNYTQTDYLKTFSQEL